MSLTLSLPWAAMLRIYSIFVNSVQPPFLWEISLFFMEIFGIFYQTTANEAAWPPYFVELMEYAMAAKLAYPITDQANLADEMKQIAFGTAAEVMNGGLFALAKTRNSRENPPQRLEDFTLVNARFSGSYGGY